MARVMEYYNNLESYSEIPGCRYPFVKILNQKIQFQVNEGNRKTVSFELIDRAKTYRDTGGVITEEWTRENGNNNWCTPAVIKAIIAQFS